MDDGNLQLEINMALPELHEETTKTLTEHLRDIGVRKREDLLFVEPDDINPFLTPIQSRRLIQAFRKDDQVESHSSNHPKEAETNVPPTVLVSLHSASGQLTSTQQYASKASWISSFAVPWEKMPARLSHTITRGDLAHPEDRRIMIRTVVEAMRVHCPNPNRAACAEVARAIVSQYPATFADKTADGNSVMSATRWMVSMEGKVFFEPEQLHDFATTLAVFFGSHYVFNLEYEESASTTLEMIQR
ncbi:hypothetical protein SKAU_G00415230 [Synaphobranchus kaupii]|uniref:Uncharacterized protein n=1 Tax=Synaphobranchus kaupii TaxID=118154 RepID=A0A9Q1E789_SYNKA|nr:hypothetical protein SKAU_G00415230 [Synaphobranchus kaupii]